MTILKLPEDFVARVAAEFPIDDLEDLRRSLESGEYEIIDRYLHAVIYSPESPPLATQENENRRQRIIDLYTELQEFPIISHAKDRL